MSMSATPSGAGPEYTGRYLMVTPPHKSKELIAAARNTAGLSLLSSRDFVDPESGAAAMDEGNGIYLDEIGIAVVSAPDADQVSRLATLDAFTLEGEEGPILEPERVVYAVNESFGEYLRGYRDAVNSVSGAFFDAGSMPGDMEAEDVDVAAGSTWGLTKTHTVVGFPFLQNWSGTGIKVAVLDTGMDLGHPDFAGRGIVSRSFVPGEAVQDGHSHGTHCIGTACGPKVPSNPAVERYGCAFNAQIFAGKVLSNGGSGADGWILGGINWAIAEGCHVISMSLGARTIAPGFSAAYENAAQIALQRGCLIVAAAGNDGGLPVSHPANCPSIMAVGAVDENLVKAGFSNITHFPPHGKVDIAGPGVGVFSSVPVAKGTYGKMSGTSMATPHVAGIAALYAQSNTAFRGAALWQRLTATAMALPSQPASHVGAGLVQAPFRRIRLDLPIPFPRPLPPILRPVPPRPKRMPEPAVAGEAKSSRKG